MNSSPGHGAVRAARDSGMRCDPLTTGEAAPAAADAERLSRHPTVGCTQGSQTTAQGCHPGKHTRVQTCTQSHACMCSSRGAGAPPTRADTQAPRMSGISTGISSSSVVLCHHNTAPRLSPNFLFHRKALLWRRAAV